jgi:hypothetical protein
MGELNRGERLQIMLTHDELRIVDTWRFSKRMPSRASAIRELLKRGMAAEGFSEVADGQKSKDFSVLPDDPAVDGQALNGQALNDAAE